MARLLVSFMVIKFKSGLANEENEETEATMKTWDEFKRSFDDWVHERIVRGSVIVWPIIFFLLLTGDISRE